MPKHLHRDLDHLSQEILLLGASVEEAINKAIVALMDRRVDLAREVLAGDVFIDAAEIEVEEDCLKVLALHQPVAADLRYVITVLKVNNDLERMGDHAAGIAGRAEYLAKRDPIEAASDIAAMAAKVQDMVRTSLDALVNRDSARAREVCRMDDEVDKAHKRMFKVAQKAMMSDSNMVKRSVQSLSVSRHLERIADLATNIAEDVIFMVDGDVVRHRDTQDAGKTEHGSG